HPQLGVQWDLGLEQPDRSQPGAVGARAIQHQESTPAASEPEMSAGDELVLEDQVVPRILPQGAALTDQAMEGLRPAVAETDLRRLPSLGGSVGGLGDRAPTLRLRRLLAACGLSP